MSETKNRLSYANALAIAHSVVADMEPYCERIEIAGSLRRKKPDVGDIEICAIPKMVRVNNLFQDEIVVSALEIGIRNLCSRYSWSITKNGDHYKRIDLGPISLDLFVTTPAQWGCIFLIRTGPSDFSHWLVTPKRNGGGMPGYLHIKDGRLWNGDEVLHTPEEVDVFDAMWLSWIEPEKRLGRSS